MPLFHRFIASLALVVASLGLARAESALQLSPALGAQSTNDPALLLPGSASPALRLAPDPSFEVQDQLPPIPTVDLTTPPDDLWQRVRNGFAMPNLESPLVADRQAWYLNRPEYLKRVFERSRRYIYHIVDELQKRGMPTELALLPLVESSFNPLAYSPARALGMWQFIPSTGKNYNLQQNWWLDQRRDIIASTTAALDYLQTIYEMHGDWHLALASYNWGEGAVGRAIAKNQARGMPTDYLSLKMPDETRYYVPKLQAIKNIVANPGLFGFNLEPIPNEPYFGTVERQGNMDVAVAARLAEIPVAEFIALNPAYSRPVMPGSTDSPIVIPADKVNTFLRNLQKHEDDEKPLSNWHTHSLGKNEKLDSVAARYGISGARLRQLNGITSRTRIGPGFTLLVPGRHAQAPEQLLAALPQTPAQPPRPAKPSKATKTGKPGKVEKRDTKSGVKSAATPRKNAAKPSVKAAATQKAAKSAASNKR